MDPRTGDYVDAETLASLPRHEAERFSVEVSGAQDEVAELSRAIRSGDKHRVLYEAAMHKLRVVRSVGKRLAKSNNPQLKAAGLDILKELE